MFQARVVWDVCGLRRLFHDMACCVVVAACTGRERDWGAYRTGKSLVGGARGAVLVTFERVTPR